MTEQFRDRFWIENNLVDKTVLCFHPGCGENGKPREWKVDNYIELGRRLHEFDKDIKY